MVSVSTVAVELLVAGVVLCVTLGVGTVAHECTHALVLRTLGIPHDLEWLPEGPSGRWGVLRGGMATVTPRAVPSAVSPWGLRLAALAPFALATPFALVAGGVLPDPLASGDAVLAAATVGWLGCALPSPQDFSLFWEAERALAVDVETDAGGDADGEVSGGTQRATRR